MTQRKFHFWMKLHGTVLILLLVYSRVARWICWFRIAVWVDATDNELISFYTPVTLSLLVPSDWWIKNFRLNLFFQLVFLFILVSRKNVNLGKCFINICIKKDISFRSFMLTITSYFCFLLAALTITSALFIGLSKIRLISN